ncbi:Ig-like domain-containing protein [Isoptericola jiangsuensis]|uniref:Ig-like domain-containing protein n=2 Tax=Isoptericola jiangsuensis TaxID=548579 RepID=A0A2A9ETD9_9MICO|nr:Ig-like domain-containing protein [Isoptericola jiangsuensis]
MTGTLVRPDGAGARIVAATTALVLALTVLVAPGARATDEAVATTLHVTQPYPWYATATAFHALDVQVSAQSGEQPSGGRIWLEVDGVRRSLTAESGRVVNNTLLDVGVHPVTVRYDAPPGYAPAEWNGTVEVVDRPAESTLTATAPDEVAYGSRSWVTVSIDVPGHTSDGTFELRDAGTGDLVASSVHDDGDDGGLLRIPTRGRTGHREFVVRFVSHATQAETTVSTEVAKAVEPLQVWSNKLVDGRWSTKSAPWDVAVYVPGWDEAVAGTVSLWDGGRRLRSQHVADMRDRAVVFDLGAGDLAPGRHTVEVRLTGSPLLADSRATLVVEVTRDRVAVTSSVDGDVRWGRPYSLDLQLRDAEFRWEPAPTGTVSVYRGTTRLWSGRLDTHGDAVAKIGGTKIRPGRTTLRVVYSGDTLYRPSTTYRSITVQKARTTVRARIVDRTVEGSQRVKVKVRVSSPSNIPDVGTLHVKVDGRTVKTVRLKKHHQGARTITLPRLSREHHWLKVVLAKSATTKFGTSPTRYFQVR